MLGAFVAAAVLSVGAGKLDLGLGIKEVGGVLLVSKVLPRSPAAAAGLEPGQRIVAIEGLPVATLAELEARLEDRRGQSLDVEVGRITQPHRVAILAYGARLTGQNGAESGFVGAAYSHGMNDVLSWVLAVGYVAVGDRPFFGRNVLSSAVGVELDLPFLEHFIAVGRALACINAPVGQGSVPGRWRIEPVGGALHAGLRWWVLEAFFFAGVGPAAAINLGGGVAVSVGFGGPSVEDPGESIML
jgi:PDZ domain-containing protein